MSAAQANTSPGLRVIVAGFGPVGRAVTELLEQAGVQVTIIELNAGTCAKQHGLNRQAINGDAGDPATLRAAGIHHADALIVTVPDEDDALRACTTARQLNPKVFIAARTNFLSKGLLATRAGADEVIVEEVVTAEAMKQAVLRRVLNGGEMW
jgi:CPA2 family monovalent cation:H+ antiporter-2